MIRWLRSLGGNKEAPLTGSPEVRRQKTYSAQSGYVYQYVYDGHRAASRDNREGTQYVFDASSDRKTSFPVSVFLSDDAVAAWERSHRRALVDNERYAVAKMALFAAFDERENPEAMHAEVPVDPAAVDAILASLDID